MMFYSVENIFYFGLLLPAILAASTIYSKESQILSDDEENKTLEDEDILQSVQTHVREKGDVFAKKDTLSDLNAQSRYSESADDYNSKERFNKDLMKVKLLKGNRYNYDRDYYLNEELPLKKKKNLEATKTTPQSLKLSRQELENQLKGQKEIAEPIMFRNRSDGHPTTRKPPLTVEVYPVQNHLPIYSPLFDESKRKVIIKTPSLVQFNEEDPETPPYDFRREVNQDVANSDESYSETELMDDNILEGKKLASFSYDDPGQLKQNMDILDESTIRRYSEQINEDESEDRSNSKNNNSEEDSKKSEVSDNESSDLSKSKINESLGRYHRLREISDAVPNTAM